MRVTGDIYAKTPDGINHICLRTLDDLNINNELFALGIVIEMSPEDCHGRFGAGQWGAQSSTRGDERWNENENQQLGFPNYPPSSMGGGNSFIHHQLNDLQPPPSMFASNLPQLGHKRTNSQPSNLPQLGFQNLDGQDGESYRQPLPITQQIYEQQLASRERLSAQIGNQQLNSPQHDGRFQLGSLQPLQNIQQMGAGRQQFGNQKLGPQRQGMETQCSLPHQNSLLSSRNDQ